jgi:hypothetical protein
VEVLKTLVDEITRAATVDDDDFAENQTDDNKKLADTPQD